MAEQDEKTEEPTAKKLAQARKEGQVGKSADLSSALILIAASILIWVFGEGVGKSLMSIIGESFISISDLTLNANNIIYFSQQGAKFFLMMIWPFMLVLLIIGLLVNGTQVGFLFTLKPLKPKFLKIFGLEGWKKLVSMDKMVDMLKGVAKMILVGVVGYQVIVSHFIEYIYLVDQTILQIVNLLFKVLVEVMLKCGLLLLILGILDLMYQKYKTKKTLKMTKQEVKDELKQQEGDPQVKSKIRSLRQEMHKRVMMEEVPKATVVVTNPTYIAIAIRYEQGIDKAPMVLAKGKRLVAEKIKEIAKNNDIPIVENKPLARGMFDVIQIGEEIPEEFFGPVAEVLAYVYRLQNKRIEHDMV